MSETKGETSPPSAKDALDIERMGAAIAAEVRKPVDDFRKTIEGIQDQVPEKVFNALTATLKYFQSDVQNMVGQKVSTFFQAYAETVAEQRKKLKLRVYTHVMVALLIFLVSVVIVAWHMLPSVGEIRKETELLQSLRNAEWETPEEFYDTRSGRIYVRVRKGTVFDKTDKSGHVETFAEIETK